MYTDDSAIGIIKATESSGVMGDDDSDDKRDR